MNEKKFSFPVKDEQFKKASGSYRSSNGGGSDVCVSVARTPKGTAVRDTKNPDKTTLFFTPNEWNAFIKGVKDGEFDS